MKLIKIFIVLLSSTCINASAQLIVHQNGYIATNVTPNVTPLSPFTVGGAGNQNYLASFYTTTKGGLDVSAKGKTGLSINLQPTNSGTNKGICITPTGSCTSGEFYGIQAYGGATNANCYGVSGHFFNVTGLIPYHAAGIYGSSSVSSSFSYYGIWAGYFNGDVRVTGSLYGTLLTPSSNASVFASAAAQNPDSQVRVFTTDDPDDNVSGKLRQVQLLEIHNAVKHKTSSHKTNKANMNGISSESSPVSFTEEEIKKLIDEGKDEPGEMTEMASIRYGLAADQLKQVFPELVYEDAEGNVSVNYIEMIPLLVQAINELQSEITALKSKDSALSKARNATGINTADGQVLSLGQNNPNPFSETTSIEVCVPDGITTANLFVYDMSGAQVEKIDITERGTTRISFSGTGLKEGMYLYSLVADGRVVGTKKMVLTK